MGTVPSATGRRKCLDCRLPEKIFIVGGSGEDGVEECVHVLTYYNSTCYGNAKE